MGSILDILGQEPFSILGINEPTKQSCECECVPAKTTQGIHTTSLRTGMRYGFNPGNDMNQQSNLGV